MATAERQPVQLGKEAYQRLQKIKKLTRLPMGVLADIGAGLLEQAIASGELSAKNGVLVRTERPVER